MSRISEAAVDGKSIAKSLQPLSFRVRVSPNSYFVALFLATFAAALLFYLSYDLPAVCFFAVFWLAIPALALSDKIEFNGDTLRRTGLIPRLWAKLNRDSLKLKVADVEQIETHALRALKRGGNVFYRYRTMIRGKERKFIFASGGEDYRRMVKQLFAKVDNDVLDNRSLELRNYLNEPKEVLMKAEFARIPSAEVLENSIKDSSCGHIRRNNFSFGHEEQEKVDYLRGLANELRLSGYLLQALEAFRRALLLNPNDPWLLFEFGRCLSSYAGTERDAKMERRANAALRLAEMRAQNDGELLSRLGESYFQNGLYFRAKNVFIKSLDAAEESFRSARGLAEISLREGKIAHVIHHFSVAIRSTDTHALKNWAENESSYFSKLNNNEDYMDAEVQRINWLDSIEKHRKMALRFAFLGFISILIGNLLEESMIMNIGWSVSSVALIAWTGLIIAKNIFAERIPVALFEEIEEEFDD